MLKLVFTLDYEIFGDGSGSLTHHVLEPAERLLDAFQQFGFPMVFFVEAAEFKVIKERCPESQDEIGEIESQIQRIYNSNHEVALHLHPQWFNASYDPETGWNLDYNLYNMCVLRREEIERFVQSGIDYLRKATGDASFMPLSFRAGNWLLQPTRIVAEVLHSKGIRIDSSVFKGGLQHKLGLDYRPSLKNGYFWRFHREVNHHDPEGLLVEIPIYTEMVPFWRLLKTKRLAISARGTKRINGKKPHHHKQSKPLQAFLSKLDRLRDFCRPFYPLKLDFCRMDYKEFSDMIENILNKERETPSELMPVVSIGHTKDFVSADDLYKMLDYLQKKKVHVTTFKNLYQEFQKILIS